MSASVPMPRDLSEEAVARLLWDAQRPDVDRFAWEQIDRVSKDGWLRMARAVRALVEREVAKERDSTREKVREGVELDRMNLHLCDDDVVALAMGRPLPSPDCKTCFGCGYIPGTYERPTCDACGGTGKEAPRG